jgi:GBF-interacting protein 1 N-terminal
MSPCLQAMPTNKSVVELVKEATGASEEDVKHTLEECDYDVNKATNMLIDGASLLACSHYRIHTGFSCQKARSTMHVPHAWYRPDTPQPQVELSCLIIITRLHQLADMRMMCPDMIIMQVASFPRLSTNDKRRSRWDQLEPQR